MSKTKYGIYRHFCLVHPDSDIVIPEDGELAKCELCRMRTKNIKQHKKTETCRKGQRRRKNEDLQDKQFEAGKKDFLCMAQNWNR